MTPPTGTNNEIKNLWDEFAEEMAAPPPGKSVNAGSAAVALGRTASELLQHYEALGEDIKALQSERREALREASQMLDLDTKLAGIGDTLFVTDSAGVQFRLERKQRVTVDAEGIQRDLFSSTSRVPSCVHVSVSMAEYEAAPTPDQAVLAPYIKAKPGAVKVTKVDAKAAVATVTWPASGGRVTMAPPSVSASPATVGRVAGISPLSTPWADEARFVPVPTKDWRGTISGDHADSFVWPTPSSIGIPAAGKISSSMAHYGESPFPDDLSADTFERMVKKLMADRFDSEPPTK